MKSYLHIDDNGTLCITTHFCKALRGIVSSRLSCRAEQRASNHHSDHSVEDRRPVSSLCRPLVLVLLQLLHPHIHLIEACHELREPHTLPIPFLLVAYTSREIHRHAAHDDEIWKHSNDMLRDACFVDTPGAHQKSRTICHAIFIFFLSSTNLHNQLIPLPELSIESKPDTRLITLSLKS